MPGPGTGSPRVARRRELSVDELEAGVLAGERSVLARAITLVESRRLQDRERAQELLQRLLPRCGGALRVGVTGVPGVGKSTFIEALGLRLVRAGKSLAVLAVDPSSQLSGGSILGDKTRMGGLTREPAAFIRPSPNAGTPGGVAARTREALLLCEAAGFDVVLVESVGVGQSETALADLVDFYLVLALAGAGDELQGIKRGVLELADLVAVTKADGSNRVAARQAAAQLRLALRTLRPRWAPWPPQVVCVSSLEDEGIAELWEQVERHRALLSEHGELAARRAAQQVRWMWSLVEDRLLTALRSEPRVSQLLETLEDAVHAGRLEPGAAADRILSTFAAAQRGKASGGRP